MEIDRKALAQEVRGWMSIELNDTQLDEILADPHVRCQIDEWGIDTCTREAVGAFLARKIVGRPWPMYGDDRAERDAFFKEFDQKASLMGYRMIHEGRP